jgi:protein-L-isoaspartate(D-aspartate) O-methyltransferase
MTTERSKRFPLALADVVKPGTLDRTSRVARSGGARVAAASSERAPRPASPARPATATAVALKAPSGQAGVKSGLPGPLMPAALRPMVKNTLRPGQSTLGTTAVKSAVKPAVKSGLQPGSQPTSQPTSQRTSLRATKLVPRPFLKPALKQADTQTDKAASAHAGKLANKLTNKLATKPVGNAGHAAHYKPSVAGQTMTVKPLSRHHRGTQRAPELATHTHDVLNSDRVRERLVERLRARGIRDARVLGAIAAVPRHLFVDAGLATQAYEDAALPIGHHQTISKPSVVARMIELAAAGRALNKVLEIGTGCGYQAAVLSRVSREVYSIERIKPLFERAKSNLRSLRLPNLRLHYGDGRLGLPAVAPFDAILLAAAGLEVPQALLEQLEIGGRLIAPVGGEEQVLTLIERVSQTEWRESRLDRVFFVPLKTGVV